MGVRFFLSHYEKLETLMKKIAILGSGTVGVTLANGFIKYGYEATIGSREEKDITGWSGAVATFSEAAKDAEMIVLAVKGTAAEDVVRTVANVIAGKVVIDVTNPIDEKKKPENGVLGFFTSLDESLMERLQKVVPDAKFVKAWNSIGGACMVDPDFGGQKPSMFFCGNDASAKEEVATILEQFGFTPEDMGSVEAARAIEPLCILWCIPGFLRNDWTHAFQLLRR